MKKLMIAIIALLLSGSLLFADEVTKVGTTALGFLNIDVGSRAVGMGGAYVSIANDATAMFWNPAGIAKSDKMEAVFHHSDWIADINFNYIAAVLPIAGIGNFGINATALSMPDMERTTLDSPEGTGEMFSAGSMAFGVAFGRSLTDRFSIGFNVKYVNESIYHSSTDGFAFDVGTQFTTQFSGLKIGMSITNYGPKVSMAGRDMLTQVDINPNVAGNNENMNAYLKTDAFDLPLMFRVGMAIDMLKGIGNSNLILSADALHPNDDVESVNVGAEYVFNNILALRGGYTSLFAEDFEAGLSFGGGIHHQLMSVEMSLDYAYRDFGLLENVQMFTLGLKF
ncbi:PorV/PorQ family protein [candidate division KSB1 bacterium]|nr:PorV/PorQ family protein [candidate division KSB1 bacterium]